MLKEAVWRINHGLPAAVGEDAFNELLRIASPDLLDNNELFHCILTEGNICLSTPGGSRNEKVSLVFDNLLDNNFALVNTPLWIMDETNVRI